MKLKFTRIVMLGGLMSLLTACPYKSKVPVTAAQEPVKQALMGEWISGSENDYDYPTYYVVDKFSDNKYKLIEKRFNTTDSVYKNVGYQMHSSTIKDKMFMNIQPANGGDYYIYLFEMEDNTMTLKEVTENIDEQFTDSKDLEKFIKKYMHLSFFYSKSDEKYFRKN